MFNRRIYANSRPDGIGVLEVVGGANGHEPGAPRLFVPLKRTELSGEIIGPLAALRVQQTYGYTKAQMDKVLEAAYRFPMPGDAAVTGVTVRFGEVEIRAELKERARAEAEYEQAKQEGRQAALVTRETPDVFTIQVAGIKPDQDIVVETAYVQLARTEGNAWALRIPLTTPPRYIRSDELSARQAQGQPLAVLRDPGHRFALDVTIHSAGPVTSATHDLNVTAQAGGARVQLREGEVLPDRDCVLRWEPAQTEDRPTLQVILHDDKAGDQVYFLAMVAPPAAHQPGSGVAREVILLVDHSGSMNGAKWDAADWTVETFLRELTEKDSFALGLFHNQTFWFDKTMQRAAPGAVEKAVEFLVKHRDSGGTELGVALEQALHLNRAPGEYARHVLVVTDAQVTDAGRLRRLVDEEAQRTLGRRRISMLCIDSAPNAFLAQELADRGGGVARFLTSRPQEEDITTALEEVLRDWGEPVFTGLRLSVSRAPVEAAGRDLLPGGERGWSRIDLGDLPAGRAVWVAGRAPRGADGRLAFKVETAKGEEIAAYDLDLSERPREWPAIKALFGARRVMGLEFLISSGYSGQDLKDQLARLGYDPAGVLVGDASKVYAENVREDARAALRDLLVRESLAYGLASSETAFVAVREEAGEKVEATVAVANALPDGWADGFLMAPGVMGVGAVAYRAMPADVDASRALPPDLVRGRAERLSADAAPSALPPAPAQPKSASLLKRISSRRDEPARGPLFVGTPVFAGGEAVLFDSTRAEDAAKLPDTATFTRLEVSFPDGAPDPAGIDRALSLLIFVDDLSAPRAKVRLADLLRAGGKRPLNLFKPARQVVRIVLSDPAGVWAQGAPRIEVRLVW
ncbi:MAG: VWA domain-containing protein [Anaerolineae bacterium]|nr:VWA domain-containing protein [Anaerolineae bacterium]